MVLRNRQATKVSPDSVELSEVNLALWGGPRQGKILGFSSGR
jgi:hypothetical protein